MPWWYILYYIHEDDTT